MEDHADSGWEEELDENLIRALDEAYCQDLQSCMKDVEPAPNEPDCGFEKVQQEATILQAEMSKFRAEERINGVSPQTWEGYDPKHAAIKENLQEVGKARRSRQPEEIIREASARASESFRNASDFFRKEREQLVQREQKYQQEIAALKKQLQEMRSMPPGQNNREMEACFLSGMRFFRALEQERAAARKESPAREAKLFAHTREVVSGVYQDIKAAPGQIRAAIKEKADRAVDAAVQRVAGVFDKAIIHLDQRRQEVLAYSPIEKKSRKAVKRRIAYNPKKKEKINEKGRFR